MSFDRNHSDALFIQALDRLGNHSPQREDGLCGLCGGK